MERQAPRHRSDRPMTCRLAVVSGPVLQLCGMRSLRHAPSFSCSGWPSRSKQIKHGPKEPSVLVIGQAKFSYWRSFLFPSSAAPLPQALPCLDRRRYWLRRDAPPHPFHRIVSYRKLGTFGDGFRVRIRPRPDSRSGCSSLGLLFPLHATTPW